MQNWISEPGSGLGVEIREQRVPEERRDGILAMLDKRHWKQDAERQGNVTANKAILAQERFKYDDHCKKMKEQTDAEEEVCKAVIAKITVKLETEARDRAEKARLRLNNFIASFGELLIEHAGVRQWVEYSFVHNSIDAIEEEINESLKTYAFEMAHETQCLSPESGISSRFSEQSMKGLIESTQVIRRYRRNIALYLCYKIVSATPGDWFSYSKRLRVLSDYERFGLIEMEHESVKMYTMDLEPIRDRLIHGESFQRMASRIRHTLYRDDGHAMETVKSCVQAHQTYGQPFASFAVELPIREFMSSQYGKNNHSVGSVVAITGSSLYAQATTCGKYLCQTWPRNGGILLELLDLALASEENSSTVRLGGSFSHPHSVTLRIEKLGIKVDIHNGYMNLKVDLAQQLAWLASVLSTSPSPLTTYAKPSIRYIPASSSFLISVQHSPLYSLSETSCWLPLFTGAVIACGFPIAARGNETGLDIPLEILAAIVGVRHAVEFRGGVCLKGFSHMLVPMCKNEDRIQWHAVSNSDENSRLTYADGISQCKNRALLSEVSLEDAFKSRAIVGWCSVVNSQLGSTTANYENIDYSGAVDAESNVKCTGGAFGFQQFGTAVLDFKLGVRDGKCHFQRNGPYRRVVSAAEKTHVVLHDTGQKRAWLVPASAVALHILQHRHQLEPFEKNRKPVELNTDVPFGSSAKNILLTLEDISLSDADDYKVKDAVLNIWSLLEFLIDQNVAREMLSPGTTIKATLHEFIAGFEFKAVVEERSPFRQKHSSLNKTNGGWPQLIRDIDALVLMADGFEDILLPANSVNTGICTSWRRVPTGLDYMTTSTRTLKDLYDVAGCRLDRKFLTSSKLRWHQGNSLLFEACPEPESKPCQCNRLQQILPKSAMGTVSTPRHMIDDGAVIFGHRGSMINSLNSTHRATEPKISGIYSQRNISLSAMATEPVSQLSPHSDTSSVSDHEGSPDSVSMYTTFSSQDETLEFIDPPVTSAVPQLSKQRQRDDIQKTPSSEEAYDSFLEDTKSAKRMRTATASSGASKSSSATLAQALASALAQRLPGCDVDALEQHFLQQHKPSTNVKKDFASKLNVPLDKINNWFQNRRAKVKQDRSGRVDSRKPFLDEESYLGT